jgi:VanZ family protein
LFALAVCGFRVNGNAEDHEQLLGRRHLTVCALIWTAFIVYGSLVPFDYRPLEVGHAIASFRHIIAQPISASLRSDFAANVLLFIPQGFLWLGVVSYRARRPWAILFVAPVWAACILLSIFVEFAQLWFPPRTSSLNDIIAESIGALVGCVLWILIGVTVIAWLGSLIHAKSQQDRFQGVLLVYCVVFAAYSVMPLDLTISIHEIYRKYRDGKILVVPFAYSYASPFELAFSTLRDVLVMAPVGAYSSICRLPNGRAIRGFGLSIALGMVYVVFLEATQLLVMSRYTDATDLVTGLVGVAIGSWLMRLRHGIPLTSGPPTVPSASSANIWMLAAAALAGLVVLGYWYPFNFVADGATKARLERFVSPPLSVIFWGSELNAVSQVFLKTVPFALVGVCLTMATAHMTKTSPARTVCRLGIWGACCGLGVVIEIGQVFLPSHTANLTDVMLYGLGSLGGIAVVSWWKDGVHLREQSVRESISDIRHL